MTSRWSQIRCGPKRLTQLDFWMFYFIFRLQQQFLHVTITKEEKIMTMCNWITFYFLKITLHFSMQE